jgi:hypothetical protein
MPLAIKCHYPEPDKCKSNVQEVAAGACSVNHISPDQMMLCQPYNPIDIVFYQCSNPRWVR